MTERRPWLRAIAWIAVLGPFFFASYGFANWLASRHVDVPAIVFDWEGSIPFVPWTIVPYWSIDLLYGLSLLICTTRREVDRQGQRLLATQLITIPFFILFPLRFSFDRPAAEGFFGALFTALGSFDKPFNQAPSLHIGLLVVIWAALAKHTPSRWRWMLHGWMVLIGISILTTYQHHFIDLPTGLAVGFFVMWLLPDGARSPLRGLSVTADRFRRKLAFRYAAGSALLAVPALAGGTWLWFLWPSLSLAMVALIYYAVGAKGFQKNADGRISVGAWGLMAPYFIGAWINSRAWTRDHPQPSKIAEDVWIGRIPGNGDLEPFRAVVDLTAELPCAPGTSRIYRFVPVLDLTVADEGTLRAAAKAIEEARAHGPVLVCCALGYSRSASAIVAWLLTTGRASSVDAAMTAVRTARPSIVLRNEHCAALEVFA